MLSLYKFSGVYRYGRFLVQVPATSEIEARQLISNSVLNYVRNDIKNRLTSNNDPETTKWLSNVLDNLPNSSDSQCLDVIDFTEREENRLYAETAQFYDKMGYFWGCVLDSDNNSQLGLFTFDEWIKNFKVEKIEFKPIAVTIVSYIDEEVANV